MRHQERSILGLAVRAVVLVAAILLSGILGLGDAHAQDGQCTARWTVDACYFGCDAAFGTCDLGCDACDFGCMAMGY